MGSSATQPVKRLGAWLARTDNTVYLASSDGFVSGARSLAGASPIGYTDSSNPPTTERARGFGNEPSMFFPVRKGDFWKTVNCTDYLWWIPLEP